MLMAPPLSVLLSPIEAVVISLSLEATAAIVTFADAWPKINKRILPYLTLPACFTAPLGGYLLASIDPSIARKLIAGVVICCSLALLSGLRYSGTPRPLTASVLGSVAGILLGATSVGAPPVILYLLGGPESQTVIRANLTIFVSVISVIGLIALTVSGALGVQFSFAVALLCPPFLCATWLGGRIVTKISDVGVRRIALCFMLIMGVWALFVTP